EGARLLARLHALPLDPRLPPAGGPGRVIEAMTRLERLDPGTTGAASMVIRQAFGTLPSGMPPRPRSGLTHGDWHLGQMVRIDGRWILIDIDDLGVGDPAWDLARPAAFYAADLLGPAVWDRFLSAYLEAGGWAVPAADPWRELDVPARALTVQLAAQAVVRARGEHRPLDETEEAMVASCARISRLAHR
ncbi:MAG TPA: phosphotransferase, partial [Thermopolyspora sp.]